MHAAPARDTFGAAAGAHALKLKAVIGRADGATFRGDVDARPIHEAVLRK
jgi:hypothetical protein